MNRSHLYTSDRGKSRGIDTDNLPVLKTNPNDPNSTAITAMALNALKNKDMAHWQDCLLAHTKHVMDDGTIPTVKVRVKRYNATNGTDTVTCESKEDLDLYLESGYKFKNITYHTEER